MLRISLDMIRVILLEAGRVRYQFPYPNIAPIDIPSSHAVEVYTVRAIEEAREAPEILVSASLAAPTGMPRLSQLVNTDSRVLIIVDDMSRPTPAHQIIPVLLAELSQGGVQDAGIRFLMALGTHRPMTSLEIAAKIGPMATRFPVFNHEWQNLTALFDYGPLDGAGVMLNRAMHESDIVIGVGSIVPHPAAGFSGGGKIIAPGVATEESVGDFHWQSVHYPQRDILGVRENPMRRQIDRIARLAGLTAIVNVVLDGQGSLVRCFCGDPVAAHRAGCDFAGEFYRVPIPEPQTASIFIIDTHPLDQDLWQGVKAMCALECIVPDGAVVIVVTPAPEGISHQHPGVLEFGYRGLASTTRLVEEGRLDKVTAHNIVQGGRLVERTQAFMVSPGIAPDEIRRIGFLPFVSVEAALDEGVRRKGRDARVVVLGMGGEICPVAV
jgi:nickel-dependent lactate racemase